MQKIFLSLSILLFLVGCETGYKVEQNSTEHDNNSHEVKHEQKGSALTYREPLDFESHDTKDKPKKVFIDYNKDYDSKFSGGQVNDGLDIGTIRVSEDKNSVRLVFDSYKWNHTSEYLGEKVNVVGSYNFDYSREKYLITATVDGYRAFSAKLPKFGKNSLVEEMYMGKYLDDSGYKFFIKLRYDANVKVFSLKNPARIVVDITSS